MLVSFHLNFMNMREILLLVVIIFLISPSYAQPNGVYVNGKVENAKSNSLNFRKNGSNVLTGERELTRYKATVNSRGEFKIFLPTTEISEWVIEIDDLLKIVDLGKAGDFKINFTADKPYSAVVFDKAGNDFNFKRNITKVVSERYADDKLQKLNPLEALGFRKEKAEFQRLLLLNYQKTHKMDKAYVDWLTINYQYEPYERSLVEDRIKPDSLIMLMLTEKGTNNDFAARNSMNYHTLIEYYVHYKFNKLSFPVKIADLFDAGIKNLTGLTKQVYLTHWIITSSKASDSLYNPLYLRYTREVSDENLISLAKNQRNKYLLSLKASNLSKENISEHGSLNEIFKKYKGKIIYIDFWASWCGPCKSEMPNAAKLKEKMKGKDVVFLYFGYKDEKENWLAARKELQILGEHYLLNSKLISEANNTFEISGIPHYVIIDKDGNIVDKKAERPRYAYDQLLKLAEQK